MQLRLIRVNVTETLRILSQATTNKNYTVRLHFAEKWFNAAGQRKFNVDINEKRELTELDSQ